MPLAEYIAKSNKLFQAGNSTEHSFRGTLQNLIEALAPDVLVTNEPKRQACGAPDYILSRGGVPLGFIEAKDLGDGDLEGEKKAGNKEQFDRYKASLDNIIFTDYLRFFFYRNGEVVAKITIGEIKNKKIVSNRENFDAFTAQIQDFCSYIGQSIKSPTQLAKLMAAKARLLANIIEQAILQDEDSGEGSSLQGQMEGFRRYLIHDIDPRSFSDVYAQTICHGMFAARLHDPTLQTFSRQEAYELIPKSNPFLKQLFGYIAGLDLDDRIKWVVDDLVRIFLACNVREILTGYGKDSQREDPIIHFYEDFLALYDPKLRKSRGVWYTPKPVVEFIVRAVDDILKNDFSLGLGLADTAKMKVKVDVQGKKIEKEIHRVQILDPATGTGTFLAEIVKKIYEVFEGQEGIWSQYVEDNLLPRLNGFELLMASYAMAHLKLDLLLTETGYKPSKSERLRIFLTNSLEEHHPDTGTLFASWLSNEANEANRLKRDCPVMVVMGNPPYSGESANKGAWIMDLMEDYKKEPGGVDKLQERNPKWINDDYVKFIRYGQHYIENNGSGILAFINPHGFLDNPTFRGMRWNLLKTYDSIYTIDLHGNTNKKEKALDGSTDENVFDIKQGVSINIFVKNGKKRSNDLAKVFHYDLYGKREFKYHFLANTSFTDLPYKAINYSEPNYFFVPKDFSLLEDYQAGFAINELFPVNSVGIVTSRDSFVTDENKNELRKKIQAFYSLSKEELFRAFGLKESKAWKIDLTKEKSPEFLEKYIHQINYRPFDKRFIYYDDAFIERSRSECMKHFINEENIAISLCKQFKSGSCYQHVIITNQMIESSFVSNKTSEITSLFPLYLYPDPDESAQGTLDDAAGRRPNLNMGIVAKIAKHLGMEFMDEAPKPSATSPTQGASTHKFSPLDILDYIYAVLHSPSYREKYKEFLKIDFPRIPYPEDAEMFWKFVSLGSKLRKVHLLESERLMRFSTRYPMHGDNLVEKPRFVPDGENTETGRVYINDSQYFEGVSLIAWEFYIGGYQPAQKWLKDRKNRHLGFEDILHYQKMIVALNETHRIMSELG